MRKHGTAVHEPLFHMAKRANLVWWKAWLIRIIAVVAALVLSGVVTILFTGENPLGVYATMIEGAFGTSRRIWGLLQNLAMLLCISLAVTPAFKMKFWNIGAEGQVLIGGLATATCMIFLGDKVPSALLILIMLVTSMLAGAVWAIIPAVFKAQYSTNETLFTLMMNYIAIQIVSYFTYQWSVPKGSGQIGIINGKTEAGWLPSLAGKDYLINIIIVAALTVAMYIYLKYSKQGYEISVVGESQNTAKYIGINVKKVIIRTMAVSGALCGVTGMLLVAGKDHSINTNLVGGQGFTAILMSWLGQFNPFIMVIMTAIVVFLRIGVSKVADSSFLNSSFSEIMVGIVILMLVGCEFFIHYSIRFRHKNKEVKA